MKTIKLLSLFTIVGTLVLLYSFSNTTTTSYYEATTKSCECTPLYTINFNDSIPADSYLYNQDFANCFAWNEFIALNWPTDGSNNFGNPESSSLVAWENYMTKEVLMPPNGEAPPPWGTKNALLSAKDSHKRVLTHASKFTSFNDTIVVTETGQAAPNNAPNWLGASNGTNLWYEVLVNKDEYDYITDPAHQFYNADKQLSWVQSGNTISLPQGDTYTGVTGAMELKAAWMELLPNSTIDKSRYKISEAVLIDPTTGKMKNAEVALIGLHIIHKTKLQPTWVWATFEHVDNAPTVGENPHEFYNLYATDCTNKTMTIPAAYSKTGKEETVTISCDSLNVSPPYYLKEGGPNPVALQVNRETPIANASRKANKIMQEAIEKNFPGSVYQYYKLVDVIWSTGPILDNEQPATIPLQLKGMQPPSKMANSSMETYAQQTRCTDCHQFSSIAGKNTTQAADFSFVLSAASSANN